jgi:hypothetical protein
MGLDMELYCDGERIAEINWLRNPFGLIRWVKDNTRDENTKYTLHNVCNFWAYERGKLIEKDEFLKTVMAYHKQVEELEEGYFFFDLSEYRTFVQPNLDKMKLTKDIVGRDKIDGEKYALDGRLMVPMSQFQNVREFSNTTLEDHKRWYKKLVDFAMLLQKPGVRFYCSN